MLHIIIIILFSVILIKMLAIQIGLFIHEFDKKNKLGLK